MILYLSLFLSLILSEEPIKKIPKLDLRDGITFPQLNLDNMIPDDKGRLISDIRIEQIKESAKNFINSPVVKNDIVIMETNYGTMKLKLFPDKAPNHCDNFKKLANSGFYDGTLFHRIIPGFMIQGGDILSRDLNPDNDGMGNPGWTINQEFNDVKHERGILSMARSQNVNSAGSQFFICVDKAYHLDGKYTVFGKVTENDKVLDKIVKLPSESKQILNNSRTSIPDGGNVDNWFEYKFGKKNWFIKKPEHYTMEDFKVYVMNRLKNKHRTHIPVIIEKVRVIDSSLINKNKK